MKLKWTKRKPTKPGWYWINIYIGDEQSSQTVVYVFWSAMVLQVQWPTGAFQSLGSLSGRHVWAGPIPLPTEPKKGRKR